jgi:hypothetical protein
MSGLIEEVIDGLDPINKDGLRVVVEPCRDPRMARFGIESVWVHVRMEDDSEEPIWRPGKTRIKDALKDLGYMVEDMGMNDNLWVKGIK